MKTQTRIVLSVLVGLLYFGITQVYWATIGTVDAKVAAGQVNDSATQYAATQAFVKSHLLPKVVGWGSLLLLVGIWLPLVLKKRNETLALIAGALLLLFATGCGPFQVEKLVTIEANQTAFLVPLEGASLKDQTKFMSVEYLNSPGVKVATKRIVIPTRRQDTGRMAGEFQWIDTMRVIIVDRTPVNREWVKAHDKGTSARDEAIAVESKESIDFTLGVVCSAMIKEEDAAKFLYYFAGKSLSDVMDSNVRGFLQKSLWDEFASLDLVTLRGQKKEIMGRVSTNCQSFFLPQGITITYVGGSEGLTYLDQNIQKAINSAFVAENDKKVAQMEMEAQAIRNTNKVAIAVAERQSAEEFAKAQTALVARTELDIRMKYAEATVEAAKKMGGIQIQPGAILPQGSSLLFGLDRPFDHSTTPIAPVTPAASPGGGRRGN